MNLHRTIILVWVLFAAALPARAYLRAAPEDSLEWTVFDSDVIVRGVVSHIDGKSVVKDKFFTISALPSVVTIDVLETLKGPSSKTVSFLNETGDINRWKTGEHLFFLLKTPRTMASRVLTTQQAKVYAVNPLILRNAWNRYPIPLTAKPDRPFFDAYLNGLQTPQAILDLARREVANPPKIQFGMLEIHISAGSESFKPAQDRLAYQPAYLNILVDQRAEKRAWEWVKSADPWDRWNGATVLSHFKSAQSIELLTPLLNDPYTADGDWPQGSDFRWDGGVGKWAQASTFPMRKVAYTALREWGAAPPHPVLYQPAHPATYLSPRTLPLILIVSGIVLIFLLMARWIRRVRWIGGVTGVSVFLLLAMGGLWLRSHWIIDDLSFPTSSKTRHEIALLDGKVRIMRFDPVDDPTPASFTSVKRDPAAQADWTLPATPRFARIVPASKERFGFKAETGALQMAGLRLAGYPQTYQAYTVPLWALCAVFAIWPMIRLLIWFRGRRRFGENCCVNCGYDLRATPNRCPECGLAASVSA